MDRSARYSTHDVAVDGGGLRVGEWSGPEGAPVVVAIHGITAHHLCFPFLADALPAHRVLAPDLRGRGRSGALPGPFGLARHADDVATAVRALAGGPVAVVGHSMGAFVALVLADRHPDLVDRLVLVDGGLPFAAAEQATTLRALEGIRARLEARFATPEEYVEVFHAHPAFAHDWSPEAAAYAAYDLTGAPPTLAAASSVDAVVADQTDILTGPDLPAALVAMRPGTTFLHAPRGFLDDPPGLYAPATVEELRRAHPALDVRPVPEVNHYTIVLSPRGAAAVADAL